MRHYLNVYKKLLELNWNVILEYRMHFFFGTLNTVIWGLINIVQIHLLTYDSKTIYGWSRDELILLTIIFNALIGLFQFFFSRNFIRFSELIHYGQFDSLLTKPLDSQFLITMWYVRYPNILRTVIFGIYGLYVLHTMQLSISISSVLFFLFFLVSGLTLMYSIWMIICTLIMWFTKLTNLVDLLFFMNTIARYPREMFSEFSTYVSLTVLPFTFLTVPATRSLINKVTLFDSLGIILSCSILFIISRFFWKYALRHYTSANR